jgi:uncharacterized membrane protein YccC
MLVFWAGAVAGGPIAAMLVLLATADWEYLRARWRGNRALRRARERAEVSGRRTAR